MPRPPSPAARFGTRFHEWVEHHFAGALAVGELGQQQLIDPDDLPGRADARATDETDLRELCDTFLAGQFGHSVPYAVEAPFSLLVGGRLVRGRIDAIYRVPTSSSQDERFLVVDWKTSRTEAADPLQLAIYRLAWAEVCGLPLEQVDAAFYYVRTDQLVHPEGLADRSGIQELLVGRR